MGRDTRDGSGKYGNLPDRIYHKTDSLTKTIKIVGQFSRLPGTPEGYTARNWLLGLVDNEGNPIEIINTNWRGYQDPTGLSPAKYIFPIPESAIIQSNGSLSNDGYGFPGG
jgi:starch-binding outer membrane protein, SusD/RagB family